MKILPVDDRILIKPIEEDFNPGGIIKAAPNAKKKSVLGEVVEVGPGIVSDAEVFSVGSTIVYGNYSGQEVLVNEVMHILLERTEILAVVIEE